MPDMDAQLAAIFDNCWDLLEEGARSRKSPLHTPCVANVDADGHAAQRVMVLRAADREAGRLSFNSDRRSPKIAQMHGQPAHVLAYHVEAGVQLRLAGMATVHLDDRVADAGWRSATNFARRCYLAQWAPGTPIDRPASGLPAWAEGIQPSDDQVAPARANFAVIRIAVARIDWLHLANSGHRRAHFWREDRPHAAAVDRMWSGQWLVP